MSEKDATMDFEFVSEIKGGSFPKEYIPDVKKGIESVLRNGVVAGYPVFELKAKVIDRRYHDLDSSVMVFQIASKEATRQGLREVNARLMDPMMQVDITTPEDYMGDILGDINGRRGMVGVLSERNNIKTIQAQVPLANMFQYVSTLRSQEYFTLDTYGGWSDHGGEPSQEKTLPSSTKTPIRMAESITKTRP